MHVLPLSVSQNASVCPFPQLEDEQLVLLPPPELPPPVVPSPHGLAQPCSTHSLRALPCASQLGSFTSLWHISDCPADSLYTPPGQTHEM